MSEPNDHSDQRPGNLPRFWLGLCLLVWGASVNQVLLGTALAIIAEVALYLPYKWSLTDSHFYRIADLSSVLFAVVAAYQFNEHSIYGIYKILGLLPVCVFPLLVAERYSTTGAIPLSALFLSLRRRVRRGIEREQFVGVAFPFMLVCVLATSAGELPKMLYLGMAFCLVAGALFVERVQRYGLATWAATIASVAVIAVTIQAGFSFAQNEIEDSMTYWFNQFAWFQTDPMRESTSIGSIGRLKLSNWIRVRVRTPLSTPLPIMLHEASYSKYNLGMWTSSDNEFEVIDPVAEASTWVLDQATSDHGLRTAKIIVDHVQDVAVAPMPYGSKIIFGSELVEVQRNRFGTALVEASPGQLEYGVSWDTQNNNRTLPTAEDLSVPNNYADVIGELADEINIDTDDPAAAVAKLVRFFRANFKYSLIQKSFYPGRTPLSRFLLQDRRGHCEYFATASALLLRHAGIPARYAVGYVVDEYSPLEKAFVARARHAHSWTEAFVDNRWITVDTTPSEWYELEHARASNWQHVQDIWSWITNQYARFQRSDREIFSDSLIWFVPSLILILLWRLRSRLRNTGQSQTPSQSIHATIGQDSELYQLSQILRTKGHVLHAGDTLKTFLVRNVNDNVSGIHLVRLFDLHYRYRFSSDGLTPPERSELRTGAAEYCQRYSST